MSAIIHAAIFHSTDPDERTTLLVTGSRGHIALNTPLGGCWRELPPGCASAADAPALGALVQVDRVQEDAKPDRSPQSG